jgi:hypothetical protein
MGTPQVPRRIAGKQPPSPHTPATQTRYLACSQRNSHTPGKRLSSPCTVFCFFIQCGWWDGCGRCGQEMDDAGDFDFFRTDVGDGVY